MNQEDNPMTDQLGVEVPAPSIQPHNSLTGVISGLVVLVIVLLGATGLLFVQNQKLLLQLPSPSPIATPNNTVIVSSSPDPTAGWKTYTSSDNGMSFKYPENYNVAEPAKGFMTIKKTGDEVSQSGISIETRLTGPYANYERATAYFNNEYVLTVNKVMGMWQIYQGKGKTGMLQGAEFRFGVTPYKAGALVLETPVTGEYEKYFDQILATFQLKTSSATTTSDQEKLINVVKDYIYSNKTTGLISKNQIIVNVPKLDGNFASGTVSFSPEVDGSGGVWFAAKIDDLWKVIIGTTQEPPACSVLRKYNFPPNFADCY